MVAGLYVLALHRGIDQQVVEHALCIGSRTRVVSVVIEFPCQTREDDSSLAHRIFHQGRVAGAVLQDRVESVGQGLFVKGSVAAIVADQKFVRQRLVVGQATGYNRMHIVKNIIIFGIIIDFSHAARQDIGNVSACPAAVAGAVDHNAASLGVFGQERIQIGKSRIGRGGLVVRNIDYVVIGQREAVQFARGRRIPTRQKTVVDQCAQLCGRAVGIPRQTVLHQKDARALSRGNRLGVAVAALAAGVGDFAVRVCGRLFCHLGFVIMRCGNGNAVSVAALGAGVDRSTVFIASCLCNRQFIVMLGVRCNLIAVSATRAGVSYDSVLGAGCRPRYTADIAVSERGDVIKRLLVAAGSAHFVAAASVLAVRLFFIYNLAVVVPRGGNRDNIRITADPAVPPDASRGCTTSLDDHRFLKIMLRIQEFHRNGICGNRSRFAVIRPRCRHNAVIVDGISKRHFLRNCIARPGRTLKKNAALVGGNRIEIPLIGQYMSFIRNRRHRRSARAIAMLQRCAFNRRNHGRMRRRHILKGLLDIGVQTGEIFALIRSACTERTQSKGDGNGAVLRRISVCFRLCHLD